MSVDDFIDQLDWEVLSHLNYKDATLRHDIEQELTRRWFDTWGQAIDYVSDMLKRGLITWELITWETDDDWGAKRRVWLRMTFEGWIRFTHLYKLREDACATAQVLRDDSEGVRPVARRIPYLRHEAGRVVRADADGSARAQEGDDGDDRDHVEGDGGSAAQGGK